MIVHAHWVSRMNGLPPPPPPPLPHCVVVPFFYRTVLYGDRGVVQCISSNCRHKERRGSQHWRDRFHC